MAKKVVSGLKTGTGKDFAKIIRMVRSKKTGAYEFVEDIVHVDSIKDHLAKKI
jgi:hypothetical protein